MAAKVSKNGKNGKIGKNGKNAKAGKVGRKPLADLPVEVLPMPMVGDDRIRVGYADLAIQGKDALSTLVAVNAAMSDVWERMSLELIGLSRATFESAAAAGAALVDARSFGDVAAIQSDFARTHVARLIAQSTRFSELGLKAATYVYEPLSARASKAMSGLGKPLAS